MAKREPLTIVNCDTGDVFDVELHDDVWLKLELIAARYDLTVDDVIHTALVLFLQGVHDLETH